MKSQTVSFLDNHGTVNISQSTPQQSKSEPLNARFESWRLQKLKAFCFDNNISLSECVRDATDLYQEIHLAVKAANRAGKIPELIDLINSISKFF